MENVLTLNAGSSSLKFSVVDRDMRVILRGQASGIGGPMGRLEIEGPEGREVQNLANLTPILARESVFLALKTRDFARFAGVGHRIVHGGCHFQHAQVIDDESLHALRNLPVEGQLHMPFELDMVEACIAMMPDVAQVACFDTAFHAQQDEAVRRLPLPDEFWQKGYRRFGFHGLNYQHVAEEIAPAPSRVIIAHLGSGASLCALQNGKSIATTMGYSTLDGLIMGTRPGSLDAGLLLGLMKFENMGHDELEHLLYQQSGLKGISGLSPDMRVLLASDAPLAKMAVDMYCRSIAQHAASLVVDLGGLDLLVFTGGVGENSGPIRERVLGLLNFLGPFETRIVKADEERVIGEQVWELVG